VKLGALLATLAGLVLVTGLIAYRGWSTVVDGVGRIGWPGLAALSAYAILPFTLLGLAWFVLSPKPARLLLAHIGGRMVRDAGGEVLPFSAIGGFVMGARALTLGGVDTAEASASTVVDVTTELIAQLGFTVLGLMLLLNRLGGRPDHGDLVFAVLAGLGLSAAGAIGFIAVQRRGGHIAEALAGRFAPAAVVNAESFSTRLNAYYARPGRIALATLIHLGGWTASATGSWIALSLAHAPVTLDGVIAIEALVAAARTAGFLAPMGLGVQEAAYALVGPIFGLSPGLALGFAFVRRARDLVVGIPILLVWQGVEGLRLVRRGGGA
jgi:glycosyltransferase 2 family protein